jgi:hypothetical protein
LALVRFRISCIYGRADHFLADDRPALEPLYGGAIGRRDASKGCDADPTEARSGHEQ